MVVPDGAIDDTSSGGEVNVRGATLRAAAHCNRRDAMRVKSLARVAMRITMDLVDFSEFLDLPYAAPFEPDLWVPTMERLADMVGGTSAWRSRLSVADGSGSGIIARADPAMRQRYIEHFGQRNPFVIKRDPRRYIREWRPNIRFHDDFLPREEVVRTEFYNDFLSPQDIRASMMIGLAADGIETCVLNINTPRDDFAAEGGRDRPAAPCPPAPRVRPVAETRQRARRRSAAGHRWR